MAFLRALHSESGGILIAGLSIVQFTRTLHSTLSLTLLTPGINMSLGYLALGDELYSAK